MTKLIYTIRPVFQGAKTITDISGKLIKLVNANEKIVSIDLSTTAEGLYFYTILTTDTHMLLGRGKIVNGVR